MMKIKVVNASQFKNLPMLVMMVLFSTAGNPMAGQEVDLDSLTYTTAKVELVEEKGSGCHVSLSNFKFKVIRHISGPKIEKNTIITSLLLRNYLNGDAHKIRTELYEGHKTEPNELILNFTYNPEPKFPNPVLNFGCSNRADYFDYGLSYIRWAVREDSQYDMAGLDALLQEEYKKTFHLMSERDGKFVFEHKGKQLLAFKMYDAWQLAEVQD